MPETCRDEPEDAGVSSPPPKVENPATHGVRAYIHAAAGILGGVYADTEYLLDHLRVDEPVDDRQRDIIRDLAGSVARGGMKASRLLKKAAKEVR